MAGRYAVVVGVDYTLFPADTPAEVGVQAGLDPLAAAEADARAVTSFLTGRGYVTIARIGTAATRAGILAALEEQRRAAGIFGSLLVYFAGHADIHPYYQDAAYLLPVDADPARLAETALALSDLVDGYLSHGPAILLCDTCPSGWARQTTSAIPEDRLGLAFEKRTERLTSPHGHLLALVSCAAGRAAREYGFVRRGVFTHYLLDYWRETQAGADEAALQAFVAQPPVARPPAIAAPGGPVNTITFVPGGQTLASGHQDGAVRLWSVEDRRLRHTLHGHSGPVRALTCQPSGPLLASAGADGRVCLWDRRDEHLRDMLEAQLSPLLGTPSPVYALAFSPDGHFLASGGAGKRVWLWRVADRAPLLHSPVNDPRVFNHGAAITCLAFSPNGHLLAAGDGHGLIVLRKIRDASEPRTIADHKRAITGLAFAPDGRILASSSDTVRLSRLQDRGLDIALPAHGGNVPSLAFSSDGRFLASGGLDTQIYLWRVADSHLLASFEGHRDTVVSLTFSPDSRLLASASADGTIRFWPLM